MTMRSDTEAERIDASRRNLREAALCVVGIIAVLMGPETSSAALIVLAFLLLLRVRAVLEAREAEQ